MKVPGSLKAVLISLGMVALVLGTLELATRLAVSSNTILNINIGGFKTFHPTRGAQLKANYRANDISINSQGILGPEFEVEPGPRAVRILTIGDSVTFSPPARNYSRVLEERLKSSFPQAGVEVIAAGVPGYSSYDALDWYDEFLHKLKPDIAIIYLGWNDLGQFHPFGLRYKNEKLAYQERTLIGTLMSNLYFLRLPYVALGRLEASRPVDTSALTAEETRILDEFKPAHFEKNLGSLVRKLHDRGSVVYLVVWASLITYPPTADELARMHFPRGMNKKLKIYESVHAKYFDALERVAAGTGTPLIDLRGLIRDPAARMIFTDTMHINVEGAERFGNYMAESIKPKVHEILLRKTAARQTEAH